MDIKTFDLITDWKQRVNVLQKKNYRLSLRYTNLHYAVGVLAVALAVVVIGFYVFGSGQVWLRNAVAVGGIISTVLVGSMIFFSFAKRAEMYRITIAQLTDARREIELFESYPPQNPAEREERIQKINAQIESVEAITLPENEPRQDKKGWWMLQGFAGAVILLLLVLFGSRLFFNQIPFLTTEQSIEFWMREAVQQGVEDWQFDPNDPLLAHRTILVNTWINELATHKVIVSLEYLNEQGSAPIDIYLSATGGFSKDAYAIVNAIQQSKSPVNTVAIGDCFSACSMILMSGTGERQILQGSRIAIHTHEYPFSGNPFSYFSVLYNRERDFFDKYSEIPLEWVNREENFYYLSPEQSIYYGVVDKVVVPTGDDK